jgi:cell division FtsZ-interacting protein ZapD
VILYEHPFNERIRTYLRLEYLLGRFEQLLLRSSEIDHHFALTTLFEIVDVGGRYRFEVRHIERITTDTNNSSTATVATLRYLKKYWTSYFKK